MHRVNRCTLAGTVWAPTSANRVPAHCHPLPGRPPCRPPSQSRAAARSQDARHAAPPSLPRAAACSTRPTIPRAPRPRIRPTARAPALRPLRLHRLRAAPGCPRPSISPPSRSRAHRPPIAPAACRHPRHPPISLLALRRPPGLWRQESHRMHPFFAKCAKKALFLATSARNACFSRSRWQHPRPMHPFPGAIGRFRMHGARILPPKALFRVEEPEITHGAKMLPAPPGLSAVAACGPAERALRPAAAACGTRHGRTVRRGPGLLAACASPPSCPRSSPPSYTRRASPPALRPPCPAIRQAAHCGRGEPSIRLFLLPSCCPRRRIAPTAAAPAPPEPQPAPTEPRP